MTNYKTLVNFNDISVLVEENDSDGVWKYSVNIFSKHFEYENALITVPSILENFIFYETSFNDLFIRESHLKYLSDINEELCSYNDVVFRRSHLNKRIYFKDFTNAIDFVIHIKKIVRKYIKLDD